MTFVLLFSYFFFSVRAPSVEPAVELPKTEMAVEAPSTVTIAFGTDGTLQSIEIRSQGMSFGHSLSKDSLALSLRQAKNEFGDDWAAIPLHITIPKEVTLDDEMRTLLEWVVGVVKDVGYTNIFFIETNGDKTPIDEIVSTKEDANE